MLNIFKTISIRSYTLSVCKKNENWSMLKRNNVLIKNQLLNFNLFSTNTNFPIPESIKNSQYSARRQQFSIPTNKKKAKKLFSRLYASSSFKVKAFATSEYYDLDGLKETLLNSGAYYLFDIGNPLPDNCLCVKAKYQEINEVEPRHIYFFEDGSVVFWNISLEEQKNILELLKRHEDKSYPINTVNEESEIISYSRIATKNSTSQQNFDILYEDYSGTCDISLNTRLHRDQIYFSDNIDPKTGNINEHKHLLEKYAFSDAISMSVKLGIWERSLDEFSEKIEYISNDLKKGNEVKLKSKQVLVLLGELFSMRHGVNLNSNFLDTPDFYWDREYLEQLYGQLYNYLAISKRTKLFNDRLDHCVDLMQILEHHLNDKRHIKLEYIIIALIAFEVLIGLGSLIK